MRHAIGWLAAIASAVLLLGLDRAMAEDLAASPPRSASPQTHPATTNPAFGRIIVSRGQTGKPATGWPRTWEWTVQAQRPPEPAMRILLQPRAEDLTPGNAAPLYGTAMLMMPDFESNKNANPAMPLQEASDYLDMPIGQMPLDEARALLERYQTALQYADLAARRTECRWDWPVREFGFQTLLPQLSKARQLAHIVRLRARVAIIEGRFDDALDSLQTGFALARHAGSGGVLINPLVGTAIASAMIEQVRELSAAPGAPNLYWALADLPRPMFDLVTALEGDRIAVMGTLPAVRDLRIRPLSDEQLRAFLDQIWRAVNASNDGNASVNASQRIGTAVAAAAAYPRARQFILDEKLLAPRQLDTMPALQVVAIYYLEEYERKFDGMTKWARLPFAVGYPPMRSADSKLSGGEGPPRLNPMLLFLPSLSRAWRSLSGIDREVAAMQAVEAVRAYAAEHDGQLPAALDEIADTPVPRDPLRDGAFGYERLGADRFAITAPALAGETEQPYGQLRYEVTVRPQ